ncbi:hypothetical protein IV203_030871 [Nitzschia inconspicua]|uniref:Uncharacterized protein n=1 Tax=Nitzschia inconspicua TaxID=303405 RepID=A0A9K3Q253_9STRA|nr:hypothetical protein IV203_030871 [Nitzschia inconspicua]
MSTPLNFKLQKSGGAYGTHSGGGSDSSVSVHSDKQHSQTSSASASASTTRRRANNPSDYGPFRSPHTSFDDPLSFPPYAELPFTTLKRRKQLQSGNSFVKWAMRGVLLSPVVALVLWSIAVTVFIHPQRGVRSSTSATTNSRPQQTRRGVKRMLPNFMGGTASQQQQQQGVVYVQSGQQLIQDENGMMMVVTPQRQQLPQTQETNGMMMVVTPQRQQAQLQDGSGMGMVVTPQRQQAQLQDGSGMTMVVTPQRQQAQPQDGSGMGMVVTSQRQQSQPQNGSGMRMVVTPQRQQAQATSMVSDQHYMVAAQQPQHQGNRIPVVGPLGSTLEQGIVQSVTNDQSYMVVPQKDAAFQASMTDSAMAQTDTEGQPLLTSAGDIQQQEALDLDTTSGNVIQATAMQEQQQQQLTDSDSLVSQLEMSPVKQAIYYYDPNDTTLSQNGDILQLPKVVYDANGKAIPLSELRQVPIYVQPPVMGSTASNNLESINSAVDGTFSLESSDTLNIQAAPAREAIKLTKWGTSTSQDQTVIVATVAVMALLVGALSARRLRSKSFLASCIENETLEDDMAYDSAYTTTAGMGGADSSYNTFGGWKGDLEKFDV